MFCPVSHREWFYRAMELTQLRLMNLWKDRHIMGFVDKGAAQQILMAKSVGSFLLRFSDSELGGITIAFKQQTNFGKRRIGCHHTFIS